ncbi:hypothetical protein GGR26_003538 [Lewinella marina]|uniref:DUF2490 domain-containing protein n=1 Tax=Neolewinella marina TaxID=438751 RepID=A0A2G0CB80_9BACT|nr:DUF2490 domain-containing protein [Neolewinella marina]NJB87752.1 hypothetical protein [Neolewinella marina]PHK97224.1 hypothetical protein CGL56_16725 [Neolewinella marina]
MPLPRPALLLLLVLLTSAASAQKTVDTQQLGWVRYHLRLPLQGPYALRQELEERAYWFPWRQHQLVSRSVVERRLGRDWNAGLGLTVFRQSLPHDPHAVITQTRTEIRPMLELAGLQTLSEKLALHHRYWAELRYFGGGDGGLSFANYRFRYRLELRYRPHPDWQLRAFDEIMVNAGRQVVLNTFDQNRYGGSLQYQFTKQVGAELGYLRWFQQRSSGHEFYDRHIVRFTLHHQLPAPRRD